MVLPSETNKSLPERESLILGDPFHNPASTALSRRIAGQLTHGSISLVGLGDDTRPYPLSEVIELLPPTRRAVVSVRKQAEADSAEGFTEAFADHIASEYALATQTDAALFGPPPGTGTQSISATEKLSQILLAINQHVPEGERFTFVVEDFALVCQRDYCSIVGSNLKLATQPATAVRFIFAVEVSSISATSINDMELSSWTHLEEVTTIDKYEARSIIRELLGFQSPEVFDAIFEMSVGIPVFIRYICSELIGLQPPMSASDARDMVIRAVLKLSKGRTRPLLANWWRGLSASEQLVVLLMRWLDEDLDLVCRPDQLVRLIQEIAGLTVDVGPILSNLHYKVFVAVGRRSFELPTEFHRHWVKDLVEKDRLRDFIWAKIVALLKYPTRFDRKVVTECVWVFEPPRENPSSEEPIEATLRQLVILHLSDLQFGKRHAFLREASGTPSPLLTSLLEDLDRCCRSGVFPCPNTIIISGDVADEALSTDYDWALDFLNQLISGIGHLANATTALTSENVVIVPGNHDISRALSELCGLDIKYNDYLKYRLAPFCEFFGRFYRSKRAYSVEDSTGFAIYDFMKEFGLIILALNSCIDVDDKQDQGRISVDAIRRADREIEQLISLHSERGEIARCKVAVWHHNLKQDPGRNDYLVNGPEVLQLLDSLGYSLALHGHIHKLEKTQIIADYGGEQFPMIVGAGSVSVEMAQRHSDSKIGPYPLSYNVLELDLVEGKERIRVHTRQGTFDPNQRVRWSPFDWDLPNPRWYEKPLRRIERSVTRV